MIGFLLDENLKSDYPEIENIVDLVFQVLLY